MSERIFVVGATGGVGSRLCPMLVAAGYQVTGTHRRLEQADALRAQGVTPQRIDLMDATADDLTQYTQGHDILVFSAGAAGSGRERTSTIDGQGPVKLIEAAHNNGIQRLYLVSAFMDAGRGGALGEGFEHYMATKRQADCAVCASPLDWVILRPGTLRHDDGDGRVNAGLAIPYGKVARGDVARTLLALIDTPAIRREIIELTDGDTEVRAAIQALVRPPA